MKSSSRAGSADNSDEEADFPAKLPPRILESLRAFTSLTFRFTSKSRARPGMISKTASPQDRWFYSSCSHPPQQDWYRADPVPDSCIPQMHRRTSDRSLYMFSGSSFSPPFVTLSGSSPVLLCLHLCCIISLPYPLHKLCFLKHLLFSASRCQPFSPVFL